MTFNVTLKPDAEMRAQKRLEGQRGRYAELRAEEDTLSGEVGSVNWLTEIATHMAAKARLEAVRDILSTFPAEVAEGYRPPPVVLAERRRSEARGTLTDNIRVWTRQIADEERHEIPALEAKLSQPPPPHHVTAGVFSRHDPGAQQRQIDLYYRTTREQAEAKRALIGELRRKVAGAERELEKLNREEKSDA